MKRLVAVLVLVAGLVGLLVRTPGPEPVPCITVTRGTLAHRVTADGTLRAITATPIALPADGGSLVLVEHAPDGARVAAGEVIARFDRTRAEIELREANAALATAEARFAIEAIRARTSAADQVMTVRAAEDTVAQPPLDPKLQSKNQVIEAALESDLARARLAQARRAAATDREVARSNRGLAQIARDRAAASRERAVKVLASAELRAPHAGLFVIKRDFGGNPPRLGARLWPGESLAELPDPTKVEAELFVQEVDGTGLKESQPVEVVVASDPTHPIAAKVTRVDALAKPRDARSPVQYLGVTVGFADDVALKLGQRVRATIKLDHENVIAVPRHAVFDDGGASVVFRRTARGFERVAVRLGVMTAGRVIVDGLADGDVIALRKPAGIR
jgi:multidrug resistance efflux pump